MIKEITDKAGVSTENDSLDRWEDEGSGILKAKSPNVDLTEAISLKNAGESPNSEYLGISITQLLDESLTEIISSKDAGEGPNSEYLGISIEEPINKSPIETISLKDFKTDK